MVQWQIQDLFVFGGGRGGRLYMLYISCALGPGHFRVKSALLFGALVEFQHLYVSYSRTLSLFPIFITYPCPLNDLISFRRTPASTRLRNSLTVAIEADLLLEVAFLGAVTLIIGPYAVT